ncbi:MAG: glycosyltransferase [Pseudolabrys sp.]
MKLSVVMPVLNEAASIEAALEALAVFRRRGVEIVVADGGSDDGTAKLARPLADKAIVAERGRAMQMNAGAKVANGDVLLFLHCRYAFAGRRRPAWCWTALPAPAALGAVSTSASMAAGCCV